MKSYQGQLLISSGGLYDPNFRHTVVLIGQHDEGGGRPGAKAQTGEIARAECAVDDEFRQFQRRIEDGRGGNGHGGQEEMAPWREAIDQRLEL